MPGRAAGGYGLQLIVYVLSLIWTLPCSTKDGGGGEATQMDTCIKVSQFTQAWAFGMGHMEENCVLREKEASGNTGDWILGPMRMTSHQIWCEVRLSPEDSLGCTH